MSEDKLHLRHLGACRTAFPHAPAAAARALLIGEDNPISSAPEHALFPYPEGCSGHRLCHKILAVNRTTYLATWRTNLCAGRWSTPEARGRATELLAADAPWDVVVILGRKVADAYKFDQPFFQTMTYVVGERSWKLVSLPHPSGRNLIWNNPNIAIGAQMLLREAMPDYPWGES